MNIQNPTRILMLTTDSAICGTERIILSLLKHLDRERFAAALVTLWGPGDLVQAAQDLGYPALNLNIKSASKLAAFQMGKQFLYEFQPQVIQSLLIHSNLVGRATVLFCRKISLLAGISTVYTVEGYGRWYAWLERLTHGLDTLYVVNSALGMRNVLNLIRLPAKKVVLVHNGIEIDESYDHDPHMYAEVRSEFGFGDEAIVIGIVAQLRPAKRHDLLIQAVARLKPLFPAMRLLIVGEGEMKERLQQLSRQVGIEKATVFTGYRNDARRLMQGMDIFALPSDVEGEPVSLMEAMNAALPIAAAATGGIPEIVQAGVSGLLSPPGNLDGFCDILVQLLSDPIKRTSMGKAGRERVREFFSAARMANEFQKLYEQCVKNR